MTKNDLYQKWKVESSKNPNMISKGDIVDIPLKEYLNRLDIMGNGNYRLYSKGVKFPEQYVSVEPYLMGHLVSDTSTQIKVRNNYVQNYMDKYVDLHAMTKRRVDNQGLIYTVKQDMNEESLYQKINIMELINNKYIPVEYLLNSVDNRLDFLGDHDAKAIYQKKKNRYCLKNLDRKLLEDIEFLARSLGCRTMNSKRQYLFHFYFQPPKELGITALDSAKVDNNTKEFAWQNYKFEVKKMSDEQYYGLWIKTIYI